MSLERFLEEAVVNRQSFVFYDSFYQAMSYLNDKEKIQYIDAILTTACTTSRLKWI